MDLADEFLQLCQDYGDIADNIKDYGMSAVREAKRDLQDKVSRLAGCFADLEGEEARLGVGKAVA